MPPGDFDPEFDAAPAGLMNVVEAEVVEPMPARRNAVVRRGAGREVSPAKVSLVLDYLSAGLDLQSVAIRTGLPLDDVKALLRYPEVRHAAESGGLAGIIELRHEAQRLQVNCLEEINELLIGEEHNLTPIQKLDVIKQAHSMARDLLLDPYKQAAAPVSVQAAVVAPGGSAGADVDSGGDWQSRLEGKVAMLVQVKTG